MAATKSDQFFVNNQKGYITPNYVSTLPPKHPIEGGKIETVEEVIIIIILSSRLKMIIMTELKN